MTVDRLKNLESMDAPDTVRFYDRIAGRGGGLPFRILAKRILGLGVDKGKLLDIACGPGHLLVALAKLSPEVQLHGLDISPNMLDACRKKFINEGLEEHVRLFEGSAYELPFSNESFDLVVNVQGLHCIDNAPLFFQEFVRVLKPGGIGYVLAYRRDISPVVRFLAHLGSWWRMRRYGIEGIGHVFDASYTPQEVEDCLKNLPVCNFEIKKTRLTMTILLNKALGLEEA